jgi:hypothetical protein
MISNITLAITILVGVAVSFSFFLFLPQGFAVSWVGCCAYREGWSSTLSARQTWLGWLGSGVGRGIGVGIGMR